MKASVDGLNSSKTRWKMIRKLTESQQARPHSPSNQPIQRCTHKWTRTLGACGSNKSFQFYIIRTPELGKKEIRTEKYLEEIMAEYFLTLENNIKPESRNWMNWTTWVWSLDCTHERRETTSLHCLLNSTRALCCFLPLFHARRLRDTQTYRTDTHRHTCTQALTM